MRWFVLCLLFAVPVLAQDPPPVPPVPVVKPGIIVPKEVKGDGKQKTPYLFDGKTLCLLTLPDVVPPVDAVLEWDLDDGPPGAVVVGGGKFLIFPLEPAGLYQVSARSPGFYSKVWFRVKGPAGPPGPDPEPDPDPVPNLSDQVKAALVGPTAKADGVKLSAICDTLAEELVALPYSILETADLFDAAGAAFGGANKLAGSYPALAEILRKVLPPAGDSQPISDTDRKRWAKVFSDISAGAAAVP